MEDNSQLSAMASAHCHSRCALGACRLHLSHACGAMSFASFIDSEALGIDADNDVGEVANESSSSSSSSLSSSSSSSSDAAAELDGKKKRKSVESNHIDADLINRKRFVYFQIQ